MNLKSGDLFAVRGKGFLSRAIRMAQWWWSADNEAAYNHVGIIMDSKGKTLEARWRFRRFNLADYLGSQILIVRHKSMTPAKALVGLYAVRNDIGNLYPVWRLPLHLLHLSKLFCFGRGVCSEQTAKFMKGAGFQHVVYGITPDDLADRWRIDRDMETIFEGVLTKEILNQLKEGGP